MKPPSRKKEITPLLLLAVFGAIWGLSEMSLGGLLHAIHFPLKGVVLGGSGLR